MIRKAIYTLLLTLLVSFGTDVYAQGYTEYVKDGLTYELSGTTAKLWRGEGNKYSNSWTILGDVTIPYEIVYNGNTYKVDFCGENLLENCRDIGNLYVDSENVPNGAFTNAHFTKLTFGPHVKYINPGIFNNANFDSEHSFNIVFEGCIESVVSGNWISNLGNNVKVSVVFNETPLPDVDGDFFRQLNPYGNGTAGIVVPEGADLPDSWLKSEMPSNMTIKDPNGNIYNPSTGEVTPGPPPTPPIYTNHEVGSRDFVDTNPDYALIPASGNRNHGNFTYKRTYAKAANWDVLYLPFTMKYSDWENKLDIAKPINIHRYDSDGDGVNDRWLLELKVVTTGEINAYYPYLVRPHNTSLPDKTAINVTANDSYVYPYDAAKDITCWSTEVKYTFVGATQIVDNGEWTSKKPSNGELYVVNSGELRRIPVENPTPGKLRAFRWYLKAVTTDTDYQMVTGGSSSITNARIRVIGDNGKVISDSDDIEKEEKSHTFYSLDGYELENPILGKSLLKLSESPIEE